jgi:DNA-binding MarR family transcriptional regulator
VSSLDLQSLGAHLAINGHMPYFRLFHSEVKNGSMRSDRFSDNKENGCSATMMRKASRRLTRLYDNALTPCGLRSTQFAILTELDRSNEPATMTELADRLVIDRSALGHNLRPLERGRLVALENSQEDRRRRHVKLTRKGKAELAKARPLWQIAQDRFDTVFGRSNARALHATLSSIANDERLAPVKG